MNQKTEKYLKTFIDKLFQNLLIGDKHYWTPIRESESFSKSVKNDSVDKIPILTKVYQSSDSTVVIKTVTNITTDSLMMLNLIIGPDNFVIKKGNSPLALSVQKLIGLLDTTLEDITLSQSSRDYIDNILSEGMNNEVVSWSTIRS